MADTNDTAPPRRRVPKPGSARPKDAPFEPSARPRRPFTPERLGPELRRLIGPTARGFGFSLPDLLMAWPDIMGARLAHRAYPEKLSRGTAGGEGGVLTLRCRGAAALEVGHEIPRIIERINTFAGYALVGRVRIVQGNVPAVAETQKAAGPPLDADQVRRLDQALVRVESPALKAALTRLGTSVIKRQ